MENQFAWVDFYRKFAGVLLTYRNKREDLITNVKQIYQNIGIDLPTLERDNELVDIDPFTVFGLFNKSSMRVENRIKIITAVKEIFDVKAEVPSTFDSIPVLNNQNATFYYFSGERGDEDIEDLWSLYDSALKYVDKQSKENKAQMSKYFDLVVNKKGIGTAKITMGLYWIAPDTFLNMDSRNEWYIYKSGKMPADVIKALPVAERKITADKYFAISE